MKRVILPVLSLFMVMAILVNTAGITVYNHFCLEEGESSLSFTKKEKCCEDRKAVAESVKTSGTKHNCCEKNTGDNSVSKIKKAKCCSQDEFSAQWQISEYNFQKNILITTPVISVPVILPEFRLNVEKNISASFDFSPPLIFSSQEILHLHSVLII